LALPIAVRSPTAYTDRGPQPESVPQGRSAARPLRAEHDPQSESVHRARSGAHRHQGRSADRTGTPSAVRGPNHTNAGPEPNPWTSTARSADRTVRVARWSAARTRIP